jgi:hypothetical protein
MWVLWHNDPATGTLSLREHFNANNMTVLSMRPFADEALAKSREFANRAERAAFCETLTRYGSMSRDMATDLALMIFP